MDGQSSVHGRMSYDGASNNIELLSGMDRRGVVVLL